MSPCVDYLPVCMCACMSLVVASLVGGRVRVYVYVCMYVSMCNLGALFLRVSFGTTVTGYGRSCYVSVSVCILMYTPISLRCGCVIL